MEQRSSHSPFPLRPSNLTVSIRRAGESFAEALESYTGIAFSLKEYEDIAIEFARNDRNIRIWREHLHRKRVTETLFDTPVTPSLLFSAHAAVALDSNHREALPSDLGSCSSLQIQRHGAISRPYSAQERLSPPSLPPPSDQISRSSQGRPSF
jgi:hypothetical protein